MTDHSIHTETHLVGESYCIECSAKCRPWEPCNCCRLIVEDPLEQELAALKAEFREDLIAEAEKVGCKVVFRDRNWALKNPRAEKAEGMLAWHHHSDEEGQRDCVCSHYATAFLEEYRAKKETRKVT